MSDRTNSDDSASEAPGALESGDAADHGSDSRAPGAADSVDPARHDSDSGASDPHGLDDPGTAGSASEKEPSLRLGGRALESVGITESFLIGVLIAAPVGVLVVMFTMDYVVENITDVARMFLVGLVAASLSLLLLQLFRRRIRRYLGIESGESLSDLLNRASRLWNDRKTRLQPERLQDELNELGKAVTGWYAWRSLVHWWIRILVMLFAGFCALVGEVLLYRQLVVARSHLHEAERQNQLVERQNEILDHQIRLLTTQVTAETRSQLLDVLYRQPRDPEASDDRATSARRSEAVRILIAAQHGVTTADGKPEALSIVGADLTDLHLVEVGLRSAILSRSNLARSRLDFADLHGARLDGTVLTAASFRQAVLAAADLSSAKSLGRTDFSGAHLPEANLSMVEFGADVQWIDADLSRARLDSARLDAGDFTRARLAGVRATRASLRAATFVEAALPSANLQRADLQAASLVRANLAEANLQFAKLREATLVGTELTASWLDKADLTDAHLTDADLTGAKLDGATLSRADLSRTRLYGVDLSKVLGLEQRQVDQTCGDRETQLPEGLGRPDHWANEPLYGVWKPDADGCPRSLPEAR